MPRINNDDPFQFDVHGRQRLKVTTAPAAEKKVEVVYVDFRKVIPVIVLPGVMGSNLKTTQQQLKKRKKWYQFTLPRTDKLWRLDSAASLAGWSMPYYGSAATRKKELHPDYVEVDNEGYIHPLIAVEELIERLQNPGAAYQAYQKNPYAGKMTVVHFVQAIAAQQLGEGIDDFGQAHGTRQQRGWGEIGYLSYGLFLDKLQRALSRHERQRMVTDADTLLNKTLNVDLLKGQTAEARLTEQDIDNLKGYRFPVHAVGYNWLASNDDSAEYLDKQIERIKQRYRRDNIQCSKVIIVTHSMGGLVARYYSEVLGKRDDIYGIIHGVMPSTGAPASYSRMKQGTENPADSAEGYLVSQVLGRDAAEMTAVFSPSPGPLQLLPSFDYGLHWLKITDRHGHTRSYPQADPYSEIYLNYTDWWGLCEQRLLNPLDKSNENLSNDWLIFENIITDKVKVFHQEISGQYHPNSYAFYGLDNQNEHIDIKQRTYQSVHWRGELLLGVQGVRSEAVAETRLFHNEIREHRSVHADLTAQEQAYYQMTISKLDPVIVKKEVYIGQRYSLLPATDNGDGTVPEKSGFIADHHLQSRLVINTEHEPAYQQELSFDFTLRAILKIAQEANHDPQMAR